MSLFKISEKFVLNKLKLIKNGNLKLINYDGKVYHFGDLENSFTAEMKVINPKFYLGNALGLPIITPQYNFSVDQKYITAQFYYKEKVFDDNSFDLSILFSNNDVAINYTTSVEPKTVSKLFKLNFSFAYIILITTLGGLILNVMPCVFPVLSMKLLSILNYNQQNFFSIRKSFFVTALGIISSFLLLSFVVVY